MADHVRYEVEDPVAVITLDRPEALNAFTDEMLADIRRSVEAAAADPGVVGIVITGAGRGFCAGLDASVLKSTTSAGSGTRPAHDPTRDGLPGLFSYLIEHPKPIVAAVNGVTADHAGIDFRPALVQADAATWAAIDRPDAAEGAAALVERRPPHFARLGGDA
jgi:enoyl-CoA hydratase/carnithine racemase